MLRHLSESGQYRYFSHFTSFYDLRSHIKSFWVIQSRFKSSYAIYVPHATYRCWPCFFQRYLFFLTLIYQFFLFLWFTQRINDQFQEKLFQRKWDYVKDYWVKVKDLRAFTRCCIMFIYNTNSHLWKDYNNCNARRTRVTISCLQLIEFSFPSMAYLQFKAWVNKTRSFR